MSLKYGKKEVSSIADVLDREHESAEAAALACLDAMETIFEQRAKFTVVGQLARTTARGRIDPGDPEAIKVALGWFSTEGDARTAAETLSIATATHEEYRVWILPVHHGTASSLLGERKAQLVAQQARAEEARKARFQASIKKYQEKREAEVRAVLNESAAA